MGDVAIAKLTRAMALRGFAHDAKNSGHWLAFDGVLNAEGGTYPAHVEVDSIGRELPRIYLVPIPNALKPVAPHISATGNLCYAASGTIVLDVFDIPGQTLACIERAEYVLGQILRGEMTEDLEEEFFACWPAAAFCILDFEERGSQALRAIVLRTTDEYGSPQVAVTDDVQRTTAKLASCGFGKDETRRVAVRRVRTKVAPRAYQKAWPPKTVVDILRWQGAIDARTRKKLEAFIHAEAKTTANGLLCVIESPRFVYAFAVVYDRTAPASVRSSRELAYASKVVPMYCLRVDDAYMAERNTPGRATLAGKKIVLAGCGTIGGFLAEYLVKAGAGTRGGELTLVDNDALLPHNVGRHRLGLNRILRNKAFALTEELSPANPSARIRPLNDDALNVDLSEADLVIDATGEEALGHLLVRKLCGTDFRPTLSVWVEGPGTAVRALLRDTRDAACVRCLKTLDREPIYEAVEGGVISEYAGHGCESLYVPFPAIASIQAACLAQEMAIDWAAQRDVPRLRTRVLAENAKCNGERINPDRLPECPACAI